ncbi:MAG TPA: hypothetical protein VGG28_07100 [Kofleriaceae bacterium]|jgi:hypothetical protein
MSDDLWSLLAGLEAQLPVRRESLEAFLGTALEPMRDRKLVAKTPSYAIEVRHEGDVAVVFTPPFPISSSTVGQRFPNGHALPPPPPGWGPADAAGTYVVDRAWGQIWFSFFVGDRLAQLSLAPGRHGSPGI